MKKINEATQENIAIVIIVSIIAMWLYLFITPGIYDASCTVSQSSDTMNKHVCVDSTYYTER